MYDSHDEGHNREHMERVRNAAVNLAKKYLPSEIKLAYIAATLHDIGLSTAREDHEHTGAKMILSDPYLKSIMSPEEIKEVAYAVKEHRASTGNPKTILGKILSDADRMAVSISYTIFRAISYGIKQNPGNSLEWQVDRAGKHLVSKYGQEGYGRRVYFPEAKKKLNEVFNPITRIYSQKGWEGLWKLVNPTHKKRILKLLETY